MFDDLGPVDANPVPESGSQRVLTAHYSIMLLSGHDIRVKVLRAYHGQRNCTFTEKYSYQNAQFA